MAILQGPAILLLFLSLTDVTAYAQNQFIKVGLQPLTTTTKRTVAPFRVNTTTTILRSRLKNVTSSSVDTMKKVVDTSFQARQKRNVFKQWATYMNESNYDKYLIPKVKEEEPVEVTVSIMIIRVHSVSDSSMDFGIEMYYRERWVDYRLGFDSDEYDGVTELNLPMAALNYVWKPDTYFLNAISAKVDHEYSVTHRAFFRLNTTGHVHYSRKISLTADCPMDLSMYPFDKQYCKLKLGTYSHSSRDLVYNWAKPRGHDVELKDKIILPEFFGEKPKTSRKKLDYTTGSFDSLELCIKFKRSSGFCVLQVFIPATAVVMSSWVALWMAEDTTFSDVLAVILAIIFLAYAYNSVMPRVSYVKLLDFYMCSCFLFVFLSLAKLVIIKYFCKKWAKENNQSTNWFLAQLAGISMAQQQQQQQGGDVEKGITSDGNARHTSGQSKNIDNSDNKGPVRSGSLRNGPSALLVPPLTVQLSNAHFTSNGHIPDQGDSDSDTDDYKLAMDQSGLFNKSGTSEESAEMEPFLMTDSAISQKKELEDGHSDEDEPNRKITFLGMEAFLAWFHQKNKKKETAMERRMRLLRWFHVVTQLALPIGFGAFFIFLLLVYPNVPDKRGC